MAEGIVIKINGDPKEYERVLKGLEEAAQKSGKKMGNNLSEGLESVNKVAKRTAVTLAGIATAIVGTGVKYNAEIEQYTAGFKTMLGSAEKATELLGNLKDFASSTPFEMTDLANASTTLLAFGEDVNDLMPDLKTLGDISLGNAEKFKGLALVFGQVKSQGKLMGQDLLQMINQGFNPLQIISEKTGESMSSLKDKMSKGAISFEMVADAMKTATSEGGKFYNAMAEQSKTASGQISTLKDNVTALAGEMSSEISEKLSKEVLPDLIDKVDELSQAWEDGSLQDKLGAAAAGVSAFGAAVVALNTVAFISDIVKMAKGMRDFETATKAGAAAQKLLNLAQAATPMGVILTLLAAVTAAVVVYDKTHTSAAEKITQKNEELLKSMEDLRESYDKSISSIEEKTEVEKAEASKVNLLRDKLFELESQIKSGTTTDEEAKKAKEEFNSVASQLEGIIPGITDALYDETGEIYLQKDAIDELCDSYIELAIAKATAAAAEEEMKEAAKSKIKAQKNRDVAAEAYQKVINDAKDLTYSGDPTGRYRYATDEMGYRDVNRLVDTETGRTFKNPAMKKHDPAVSKKQIEDVTNSYIKANEEVSKFANDERTYYAIRQEAQSELTSLLKTNEEKRTDYVTTGNAERTKSTKTALEKWQEALEKQIKDELTLIKEAHQRGELTDAQYYAELQNLREKYFAEGTEGMENYTEDILDINAECISEQKDALKSLFDDFQKYAEDAIDKVAKKHEALEGKLKGQGSLFKTVKIDDGTGNVQTLVTFNDTEKYKKASEDFTNALNAAETRLKNSGLLDEDKIDELMDMLMDMDVDMGTQAANLFANSSDTKLYDVISDFLSWHDTAEGGAASVFEDEYEDAVDNTIKYMTDEFEKAGLTIPEGFFNVGTTSAKNFGTAFKEELHRQMAEARMVVQSFIASLTPNASGGGGGKSDDTSSTTVVNNQTFNIGSEKETSRQQVENWKNVQEFAKRSGN